MPWLNAPPWRTTRCVECTHSRVLARSRGMSPAAQCGQTSRQIASKSTRDSGAANERYSFEPMLVALSVWVSVWVTLGCVIDMPIALAGGVGSLGLVTEGGAAAVDPGCIALICASSLANSAIAQACSPANGPAA